MSVSSAAQHSGSALGDHGIHLSPLCGTPRRDLRVPRGPRSITFVAQGLCIRKCHRTIPSADHVFPAVHALRQHGVLLPEIDSCLELRGQLPSEPVFQASRFRGRRGPDPILFVGVSFIFPSASELMARFRVCWVRSRPQRGHRWAPGYRFEQNVSVPPSLFRCRQ